jgi:hypothetical protein
VASPIAEVIAPVHLAAKGRATATVRGGSGCLFPFTRRPLTPAMMGVVEEPAMSTREATSRIPKAPPIPPLQSGDRLTAEEFERRFDAMPGLKKAELIDGRPRRSFQNEAELMDGTGVSAGACWGETGRELGARRRPSSGD